MSVHIFGNTALQASATYGLLKAAVSWKSDPDVLNFIENDFTIGDGITLSMTLLVYF